MNAAECLVRTWPLAITDALILVWRQRRFLPLFIVYFLDGWCYTANHRPNSLISLGTQRNVTYVTVVSVAHQSTLRFRKLPKRSSSLPLTSILSCRKEITRRVLISTFMLRVYCKLESGHHWEAIHQLLLSEYCAWLTLLLPVSHGDSSYSFEADALNTLGKIEVFLSPHTYEDEPVVEITGSEPNVMLTTMATETMLGFEERPTNFHSAAVPSIYHGPLPRF